MSSIRDEVKNKSSLSQQQLNYVRQLEQQYGMSTPYNVQNNSIRQQVINSNNNLLSFPTDEELLTQIQLKQTIEEATGSNHQKKLNPWETAVVGFNEFNQSLNKGIIKVGEGIVDFVLTGFADLGKIFGADTSGLESTITRDFSQDAINVFNQVYNFVDFVNSKEVKELAYNQTVDVLPPIAENIAGGVGSALGYAVLGAIPYAGPVLMFGSAAGSGAESALQEGHNLLEASTYGAISGGIEMAVEKLTGGLSKALGLGGGKLAGVTKMGRNLGSTTANKSIAKEIFKNMGEEGIEEVISNLVDPINRMLTLGDGEGNNVFERYADVFEENGGVEGLVESFIGGAIGAGVVGGSQTMIGIKRAGGTEAYRLQMETQDLADIQSEIIDLRKDNVEGKNDEKIAELEQRKEKIKERVGEKFKNFLEEAEKQDKEFNDVFQKDYDERISKGVKPEDAFYDANKYAFETTDLDYKKNQTYNYYLSKANATDNDLKKALLADVSAKMSISVEIVENLGESYFDPKANVIKLNENDATWDNLGKLLTHEWTHAISTKELNDVLYQKLEPTVRDELTKKYSDMEKYRKLALEKYKQEIVDEMKTYTGSDKAKRREELRNAKVLQYVKEEVVADYMNQLLGTNGSIKALEDVLDTFNSKGLKRLMKNFKMLIKGHNIKDWGKVRQLIQDGINENRANPKKERRYKAKEEKKKEREYINNYGGDNQERLDYYKTEYPKLVDELVDKGIAELKKLEEDGLQIIKDLNSDSYDVVFKAYDKIFTSLSDGIEKTMKVDRKKYNKVAKDDLLTSVMRNVFEEFIKPRITNPYVLAKFQEESRIRMPNEDPRKAVTNIARSIVKNVKKDKQKELKSNNAKDVAKVINDTLSYIDDKNVADEVQDLLMDYALKGREDDSNLTSRIREYLKNPSKLEETVKTDQEKTNVDQQETKTSPTVDQEETKVEEEVKQQVKVISKAIHLPTQDSISLSQELKENGKVYSLSSAKRLIEKIKKNKDIKLITLNGDGTHRALETKVSMILNEYTNKQVAGGNTDILIDFSTDKFTTIEGKVEAISQLLYENIRFINEKSNSNNLTLQEALANTEFTDKAKKLIEEVESAIKETIKNDAKPSKLGTKLKKAIGDAHQELTTLREKNAELQKQVELWKSAKQSSKGNEVLNQQIDERLKELDIEKTEIQKQLDVILKNVEDIDNQLKENRTEFINDNNDILKKYTETITMFTVAFSDYVKSKDGLEKKLMGLDVKRSQLEKELKESQLKLTSSTHFVDSKILLNNTYVPIVENIVNEANDIFGGEINITTSRILSIARHLSQTNWQEAYRLLEKYINDTKVNGVKISEIVNMADTELSTQYSTILSSIQDSFKQIVEEGKLTKYGKAVEDLKKFKEKTKDLTAENLALQREIRSMETDFSKENLNKIFVPKYFTTTMDRLTRLIGRAVGINNLTLTSEQINEIQVLVANQKYDEAYYKFTDLFYKIPYEGATLEDALNMLDTEDSAKFYGAIDSMKTMFKDIATNGRLTSFAKAINQITSLKQKIGEIKAHNRTVNEVKQTLSVIKRYKKSWNNLTFAGDTTGFLDVVFELNKGISLLNGSRESKQGFALNSIKQSQDFLKRYVKPLFEKSETILKQYGVDLPQDLREKFDFLTSEQILQMKEADYEYVYKFHSLFSGLNTYIKEVVGEKALTTYDGTTIKPKDLAEMGIKEQRTIGAKLKDKIGKIKLNFLLKFTSDPRVIIKYMSGMDDRGVLYRTIYKGLSYGRHRFIDTALYYNDLLQKNIVSKYGERAYNKLRDDKEKITLSSLKDTNGKSVEITIGQALNILGLYDDTHGKESLVEKGMQIDKVDYVLISDKAIELRQKVAKLIQDHKDTMSKLHAERTVAEQQGNRTEVKKIEEKIKKEKADYSKIENETIPQMQDSIELVKYENLDRIVGEINSKLKMTEENIYSDYLRHAKEIFAYSKDLKIETDNEIMGYSNVIEGSYWRINASDHDLEVEFALTDFQQGNIGALNPGWNKSRSDWSKPRIDNAVDVVTKYQREMQLYYGYASQIKTIQRFLTYKVDGVSVRDSLEARFDEDDKSYFVRFLKELVRDIQDIKPQNSMVDNKINKVLSKIKSNSVVATLGLNIKVMLSQAASFGAATKYLRFNNMMRGIANKKKYSHIEYPKLARYRAIAGDIVSAETSGWARTQRFLTLGIQKVDEFTIDRLWYASLYQVDEEAQRRGIKLSDEELTKQATELFEKVVNETQPNYDTLERTAMQRGRSLFLQIFNMFRTQQSKMWSGIMEELLYVKTKKELGLKLDAYQLREQKERRKGLASMLVWNGVVYSIMTFIINKMLNGDWDEDEEEDAETMLEALVNNGIIGLIPFVGNIVQLDLDSNTFFSFNDVSISFLSSLNDMFEMIDGFENVSTKKVIDTTTKMFGIPTNNVYKAIRGIGQYVAPGATANMNYYYTTAFGRMSNAPSKQSINYLLDDGKNSQAKEYFKTYNKAIMNLSSSTTNEMWRLYKDNRGIALKTIPTTLKYKGKEIQVNTQRFKNNYSKVSTILDKFTSSNLDDETKASAIQDVLDIYYNYAKKKELGTNLSFIENLIDAGYDIEVNDIIALQQLDSIEASDKKKAIQTAINRMNGSKGWKYLIYAMYGYSLSERDRNFMINYLRGRANINKIKKMFE